MIGREQGLNKIAHHVIKNSDQEISASSWFAPWL